MSRVGPISQSYLFLPPAGSTPVTPTQQATDLEVFSRETEQDLEWVNGNGTHRIIVAKQGSPVDSFPVDNTEYIGNSVFGAGEELGTGNFVVGVTTGTTLTVTGLIFDTQMYYDVYEMNSDGFKYLLSIDTNTLETFSAFTYDDQFVEGGANHPGYDLLLTEARMYYDFTKLTGADDADITNGDAGFEDYSVNSSTLTGVNTPKVNEVTVGAETVKALKVETNRAADSGNTGANLFGVSETDRGFTIYSFIQTDDGIPSAVQYFWGLRDAAGGTITVCYLSIQTDGRLRFNYVPLHGTLSLQWQSTSAYFTNGVNAAVLVEIDYDFSANTITVTGNGTAIPGSISTLTMAACDPEDWTNDLGLTLTMGSRRESASTISTNTATGALIRYAVFPTKLTSQEKTDIRDYIMNYFDDTPSGLGDYIVNDTVGFNITAAPGALQLEGEPLGFQDWISHNDIFDADLEEFELEILFEITDNPTTGTPGIGLGIRNDLDIEANRAVVAEFITDTDSPNYGTIQIYSGNGTVSQTAFAFRSQSSGSFIPVLGSRYKFTFRRERVTNDAVYTAIITDMNDVDEPEINIGYTEVNAPSTAFFGTTMRTWIHQNGGDHTIEYFVNRRIGDITAPPPTPGSFDVFVDSVNGLDSNDGYAAVSAGGGVGPKRSVNGGLQAITALGVGTWDMSLTAGTYIETSFLTPPTTLGLMQGAGVGLTIIKGSSALYTPITDSGRTGNTRALMNMQSAGSTNVSTIISGITFEGNKNIGLNTNSIRHCFVIENRHGVTLEDIEIKFFNTTALKLGNVDEFTMQDFYIRSSSGEDVNQQYAFYQIQTYNIGGAVQPDGTNFKIRFVDGLLEALESTQNGDAWSEGPGWGITGGPTVLTKYDCNVEWDNVEFRINKNGIAMFSGHRFNMEGLYQSVGNVYIHDCKFNNNVSWGGLGDLVHSLGQTRVYNCHFVLEPDPPTFVMEMQISNIEIDHNFIQGATNGLFISLNDQATFGNPAYAAISRGDHGNWNIHHNIIEITTNSSGYGMVGGTNWDTKGITFEHNTIVFKSTSGGPWRVVVVDDTVGSNLTGLIVQNNLFLNQYPSTSTFWGLVQGTITGGISRYNYSTHLVTNQSRTGVTVSNNPAPAGAGNPFSLGLGTAPTTLAAAFNGNYYRPSGGSTLVNAGFGGLTIGALEP